MKIHNPPDIWPVPAQFQQIDSHAVETELRNVRQLHVSGQVGVRPDGTVSSDVASQREQAIENVDCRVKHSRGSL